MFEAVDIYCERLGPEFWAEPANALTNAFFLVVAWLTWRRAKALDTVSPAVWALVVLLCAIGIGSFLFHTFAIAINDSKVILSACIALFSC